MQRRTRPVALCPSSSPNAKLSGRLTREGRRASGTPQSRGRSAAATGAALNPLSQAAENQPEPTPQRLLQRLPLRRLQLPPDVGVGRLKDEAREAHGPPVAQFLE